MKTLRIGVFVLMIWALMASAVNAEDAETAIVDVGARDHLSLTIYQNDLTLVRDTRGLVNKGATPRLVFPGVSSRLIPGSVALKLSDARVVSLNLALQPLSMAMLLAANVGSEIDVVRAHPTTGAETVVRAKIISVANGVVLEMDGRIETGIPGRLAFDDISENLRHRPAIIAHLDGKLPNNGEIDIRYLTDGIGWRADHIIDIVESDGASETVRLDTWATITNMTGLDLPATALSLVAGSLNREAPSQPMARAETMMMSAAPAMDMPVREGLGDFHIYHLPGNLDVPSGEPVQVSLVDTRTFSADRLYVLAGGPQPYYSHHGRGMVVVEHPVITHTFENTGGEPIPSGIARIYGDDRYLGEDQMPSTPRGGMVSLSVGQAFDISAERRQIGFRILGENGRTTESDHQISLKNAGDHDVVVEVRESIPGDWKLLKSSHDMHLDGMVATWQMSVRARGSATLTYSVRVQR